MAPWRPTAVPMGSSLDKILNYVFPHVKWDDSVERTAERVLAYWREYSGTEPIPEITTFQAIDHQLVVVRDVEFSSICRHHLLPFLGVCHLGYFPNERMIGLSKVPRIVDYYARRPQMQEAMTREIASFFKSEVRPLGVAVVVKAQHTCMACRGVRKHNGLMVTSEMRGVFRTSGEARREFLEMIR